MLSRGPRLFQFMYNRPMQVSPEEARRLLRTYKGRDAGGMTMLVRNLEGRVGTASCSTCGGGGTAFTLIFGDPIRD